MELIKALKGLAWAGLILASFAWLAVPEYRASTEIGQYGPCRKVLDRFCTVVNLSIVLKEWVGTIPMVYRITL